MKRIVLLLLIVLLTVQTVTAARLPVVGEDANEWGTLLNDYLRVSHTPEGYLSNVYSNGSNMTFEGATSDDFAMVLQVTDPTEDRTITLPDASGEVCLLGQTIESEEIADQTIAGNDLSPSMSITTTGNIILDSVDSFLKILGSNTGETGISEGGYYGIFDIALLSGDRYYTFPDISGTVVVADDNNGNSITTTGNIILDSSDSDLWILDNDGGYYGVIDVDELSDETYYTFPDNGGGEVSVVGQTIDSGEIEDGTITADDISDGTITDADIADGAITIGDGGTQITLHYSATAVDLVSASVAARSCGNYGTITVGGAAVGDTVVASPDAESSAAGIEDSNLVWNAYVSTTDMVTIRACNPTNADIDADDDQEWRADVWKH